MKEPSNSTAEGYHVRCVVWASVLMDGASAAAGCVAWPLVLRVAVDQVLTYRTVLDERWH